MVVYARGGGVMRPALLEILCECNATTSSRRGVVAHCTREALPVHGTTSEE